MTEVKQPLSGGKQGIYLTEQVVHRPVGDWSSSVQNLLTFLSEQGFTSTPKPLGFDHEGNEMLSFVAGDTYNYPLKGNISSEQAVISAAKLLRSYHDQSTLYIKKLNNEKKELNKMPWMLPSREPFEVICHGDFAPYNVALSGEKVTGIFDFDTAHPAPRLWDIAYAVYCWAPFKTDKIDKLGDLPKQMQRAKMCVENYGLDEQQKGQLVVVMIERLQALIDYMLQAAEQEQSFSENIEDGHHIAYQKDQDYLQENRQLITDYLLSK